MTQERAELNWYHKPPDYFSVRDRKALSAREEGVPEIHSAQQAKAGPAHDTEAGEFTFDDFLDIINPLHHLPIVSSIYREVTGDQISAHARIIGGGLYGGGTGFVSSIANAISKEASGRDLGENLVAAVFGEDEGGSDVLVASGDPVGVPSAASDSAPAAVLDGGQAGPAPDSSVTGIEPGLAKAPPATKSGIQTLTGDAALSALFADVGSKAPPSKSVVPVGSGTKGAVFDPTLYASIETDAESGGSLTAGDEAGSPGFADRMLLGLQKYEEMVRQRPLAAEQR